MAELLLRSDATRLDRLEARVELVERRLDRLEERLAAAQAAPQNGPAG